MKVNHSWPSCNTHVWCVALATILFCMGAIDRLTRARKWPTTTEQTKLNTFLKLIHVSTQTRTKKYPIELKNKHSGQQFIVVENYTEKETEIPRVCFVEYLPNWFGNSIGIIIAEPTSGNRSNIIWIYALLLFKRIFEIDSHSIGLNQFSSCIPLVLFFVCLWSLKQCQWLQTNLVSWMALATQKLYFQWRYFIFFVVLLVVQSFICFYIWECANGAPADKNKKIATTKINNIQTAVIGRSCVLCADDIVSLSFDVSCYILMSHYSA